MLGYIYRIPVEKIKETQLFKVHHQPGWYPTDELRFTKTGQMYALAGLNINCATKECEKAKAPGGFYIFVPEDLDINYKSLDKISNYKYGPIDKDYELQFEDWDFVMLEDSEVFLSPSSFNVDLSINNPPIEYLELICNELDSFIKLMEYLDNKDIIDMYNADFFEYEWKNKIDVHEQLGAFKKKFIKHVLKAMDKDDHKKLKKYGEMIKLLKASKDYFPEEVIGDLGLW